MAMGQNLPGWQSGVNRESKLLVCEMSIQMHGWYGSTPRRRVPTGGGANPGPRGRSTAGLRRAVRHRLFDEFSSSLGGAAGGVTGNRSIHPSCGSSRTKARSYC
jgi:hypothetical protein